LANTGFQTVYNNTGLEPKHNAWSVICKLGKWNSVKWNETHRIKAIFASFWVARVCQRLLAFLLIIAGKLNVMFNVQLLTVNISISDKQCPKYTAPLYILNCFNSIICNKKKTGKTGSRIQKRKLLINTTKQQNQTNFCLR